MRTIGIACSGRERRAHPCRPPLAISTLEEDVVDLYMTDSGRRVTFEFPPDLAQWPELAKVVENARRLDREFQKRAQLTWRRRLPSNLQLARIALDSQRRS